MHSVVDWFACAPWINGQLVRSLSMSPESGILEDIGPKLPFEVPYWSGQHPATDGDEDDYPFRFHPLELGEAALKAFFDYQLEGSNDPTLLQPDTSRHIQTFAVSAEVLVSGSRNRSTRPCSRQVVDTTAVHERDDGAVRGAVAGDRAGYLHTEVTDATGLEESPGPVPEASLPSGVLSSFDALKK